MDTPSEDFRNLVHNLILRAFSAFDPLRVQVSAFDPKLELDLAVFASLRAVSASCVPSALASAEEFQQALSNLRNDVADVDDRLTAAGLEDFWDALEQGHSLALRLPLRILIVASPLDELQDTIQDSLLQLRKIAAKRGLLIVQFGQPPDSNSTQSTISLSGEAGTIDSLPGIEWTPDLWADANLRKICEAIVQRPRNSSAPTVNFRSIVDSLEDPWMSEADEGVEAKLGSIDGEDLVLHLRSENPPMPNALVGGAVGQGKSNLLLVMIYSLAARYSPAELEMVLIDLRDGVEFARLGPSKNDPTWLPHVRALGLEFDPDYCLAVLRWLRSEMERRSLLLKENETTTLGQYRAKTGRSIPRLLVVIDEFQRLFEGDDDQAATAARELDDIARTGRGFGIHLVLASQALSGIRGLATKSESIFGQFHNRVVLKNTRAESQSFLTSQNFAAAELEYRGQAVFNDGLGVPERNRIGTIAYAEPEYLSDLKQTLYRQGRGKAPTIFRASSYADWKEAGLKDLSSPEGIVCSPGIPIELEPKARAVTLKRAPNQVVAVLGSNRKLVVAILARAVVTAANSIGEGAKVVVLDADSFEDTAKPWIAALIDKLTQNGAQVERIKRADIPARILQLSNALEEFDLVVPLALDSVDLSSLPDSEFEIPSDGLQRIAKSGPLANTWTIGWWQSKSVLTDQLGFQLSGIRAWAFAGVSKNDISDIAGPRAQEPLTSPRFVWFDSTNPVGAETLVPFDSADILGGADFV